MFVNYDLTAAQKTAFLAQLPTAYRALVRSRLWYDVHEYLGLDYSYEVDLFDAPAAVETALFTKLSALAQPESGIDGRDITLYQEEYNAQATNVLDVSNNHFIDAPSVEQWLADNAGSIPGVETSRNTIFFINWWGNGTSPQAGFKFHTYTKFGEPDPDTGYDFGKNRQTRKFIAWGGTPPAGANGDEETGLAGTHRIWFHDLSAGPEWWTRSFAVDGGDVDLDGVGPDYVIPPVWEYLAPAGYAARHGQSLQVDLGKLARYVAINLLFTSSPLYPPYITPPRQPRTINLDLNTFEGWNGVDTSALFQKPAYLLDEDGGLGGSPALGTADGQLGAARAAMAAHDYSGADANANAAYETLRTAYEGAKGALPFTDNGWILVEQKRGKGHASTKAQHRYAWDHYVGVGTQRGGKSGRD